MLCSLQIENIAVAKSLRIDFRDGFTVLTGRTGAGKSIIIDSLLLLCGSRGDRELIRTGEDRASVSAVFRFGSETAEKLGKLGIDTSKGELELSRQLTSDGKSTARIGGKPCPVSLLREAGQFLMGIQTQDDRNEYADRSSYAALLDRYAGIEDVTAGYAAGYAGVLELRSRIRELSRALEDREMTLEILKRQKKEIDSARLSSPDEEEKLEKMRMRLKGAEKISKYASVVTKALTYNEKGVTAAYLMERAQAALEMLADVMPEAEESAGRLRECIYEINDISERASSLLGEDGADPAEKLEQVEQRLAQIAKLERKYGENIPEILKKRESIVTRISDLEDGDFRMKELREQLLAAETACLEKAAVMTRERQKAASSLSSETAELLRRLEMPKVRFTVSVTQETGEDGRYVLKPDGTDDIDMLISVNEGEDIQSLGKVASGGELSRITLALKKAMAGVSGYETLIFDEIDTGVSGGTSERIGLILSELGESVQVIAVTHSSQIASLAQHHLLIEKSEHGGRTESSVREISGEDRTLEIARIIGGIDVTEKQTAAASEMLGRHDKRQ